MRVLIATIIFVGFALLTWAIIFWISRAGQRYRDRTAMIKDDNYLALEQATDLLKRIIEQDNIFPALQTNHRNEAEDIIATFRNRQLRKGK